jgi:sugar/nucleoside kinase (ribokinase family)
VDVLTVGEALACFTPVDARLGGSGQFRASLGGAEFNTAVGLARLGSTVSWCSRLGGDPFGDAILARAETEGISTSLVSRDQQSPTAIMFKDRSSPHQTTTFYYRHDSAASRLSTQDLSDDHVRAARHIHMTGISMWIGARPKALVWKVLRAAKEAGISVSFDPNFRPQLASLEEMLLTIVEVLPFVTTFLCNQSEAAAITGRLEPLDAAAELSRRGPSAVVVKRGAEGVVAVVNGQTYTAPAWPVEPVDPVGAGDAFNAGWIHSQLAGLDPTRSLELSSFVAAQVVSHETDHDGFPRLAEVDAWRAAHASGPEVGTAAE